jgi:hypothetical protein
VQIEDSTPAIRALLQQALEASAEQKMIEVAADEEATRIRLFVPSYTVNPSFCRVEQIRTDNLLEVAVSSLGRVC